MPWVFPFLLSWFLCIVLSDRSRLKETLPFGLLSMFTELAVDITAIDLGFYYVNFSVIDIFGVSLFFMIGPAFNMGILYVQSIPENGKWMMINIFVWALLFMAQEFLWVAKGAIVYVNWTYIYSMLVDILAFALFTAVYLKKKIR